MSITQNLSDAWRKVVQSHKIVNVLMLIMATKLNLELLNEMESWYFMRKDSTGEPITATVEERTLDGSDFVFNIMNTAPQARWENLHPGRQPDISSV